MPPLENNIYLNGRLLNFPFSGILRITPPGRKCEYRLLGVNGKLCGIVVVPVHLGNGKTRLIVAIHPPASIVLLCEY